MQKENEKKRSKLTKNALFSFGLNSVSWTFYLNRYKPINKINQFNSYI